MLTVCSSMNMSFEERLLLNSKSISSHYTICLTNHHFSLRKAISQIKKALKSIFEVTDAILLLPGNPNSPARGVTWILWRKLILSFQSSPFLESDSWDSAEFFLLKTFILWQYSLECHWRSIIPVLAENSWRIWRQLLYPSLRCSPWKNTLSSLDCFSLAWP